MRRHTGKNIAALMLAWAILIAPLASFAQTRVVMPKNSYKVQDDIKLGREAAAQVDQQFPLLNDSQSNRYLEDVGRRLADAIPPEFQHPEFQYSFKLVNARDINAFALPGGPMYVNRGMIEAAQNEGEMAGVMAHELSHVALRHATAQQTKLNNPLNQILGIGAVLGGAILGGQSGAALGQTIASGFFLRYSREYESQADTLGAQIMARAGYDPRDLANMFQTIERQSGGSRNPEWLSSHPDPGNRYNSINREASLLRVSPEPIKITPGFTRTKRYLQSLPQAPTMADIERNTKSSQGQTQTSGGRYENSVQIPSSRTRVYSSGDWIRLNIPDNWRDFPSQTEVWFAPDGAFGDSGITRGALIGVSSGGGGSLQQATSNYVQGILQSNNYLRQRNNYTRATIAGRNGLATTLAGTSPVTRATEITTIYTTQLRSGDLFYVVTVAPQNEASSYDYAFRNMLRSIQLNDR